MGCPLCRFVCELLRCRLCPAFFPPADTRFARPGCNRCLRTIARLARHCIKRYKSPGLLFGGRGFCARARQGPAPHQAAHHVAPLAVAAPPQLGRAAARRQHGPLVVSDCFPEGEGQRSLCMGSLGVPVVRHPAEQCTRPTHRISPSGLVAKNAGRYVCNFSFSGCCTSNRTSAPLLGNILIHVE